MQIFRLGSVFFPPGDEWSAPWGSIVDVHIIYYQYNASTTQMDDIKKNAPDDEIAYKNKI